MNYGVARSGIYPLAPSVSHVRGMPPGRRLPYDGVVLSHTQDSRVFLRICSWCERVLVHTEWQEAGEALRVLEVSIDTHNPLITHGICPSCAAEVERQELHG